MRERNLMRTEILAALGVALEALLLGAWSITVLVSGLTGERVVTQDGSETTLGAFMFVVALMLAGISFAVWREVRWATGPAITLQVLLIGGAVISTDFLSLPIITIIILYAIAVSLALIKIRRAQFLDGPETI
ncbi:hypothetical protein [Flaviflexus equikiangi]|uniref:DUF2127 domain-containing protein n=1 Tax=Flaviflexus equikiangi TaxID=2758573 RepID=A0ABS2TFI5_9ACTO|nr:hypothetical protein [Flaviflexus equikiangi]MBM9433419.1 hypothetical protein [Flaviflexus equikiangi]